MMHHPSFVLLFQVIPRIVDPACGPATSTLTATRREDADTDIGIVAASTQTFTKAEREEPDTDPYRSGVLAIEERRARAASTATRTDSREEPDEDQSLRKATCIPRASSDIGRSLPGLGERSFLWCARSGKPR